MSRPSIKSLHLISDLIGLFRTHTVLCLFFLVLLFIFVLSLLIRIRWQNEREDERECVWQKSQPGRACELVVPPFSRFFPPHSNFVTLFRPFCDIHGPGIILPPGALVRLARRCEWRGQGKETGQIHRTAFSFRAGG